MELGAASRAHWRKVEKAMTSNVGQEMDDHQFSGLLAKKHNITS